MVNGGMRTSSKSGSVCELELSSIVIDDAAVRRAPDTTTDLRALACELCVFSIVGRIFTASATAALFSCAF